MPESHLHAALHRPRFRILHAALLGAALLAGCPDSDEKPRSSPGISLSRAAVATTEGGAEEAVDVMLLTPPTTAVVVFLQSTDLSEGTLRDPGGFTASTVSLTFTPTDWNVAQTVHVVPANDLLQDGNVTYDVNVGIAVTTDPAYSLVPDRVLSVTNADDDVVGYTVSKAIASTDEAGATDTFTVRLNLAPTGTVTIPVSLVDTSEGLLRGGSSPSSSQPSITLTFTTGNWSTPQTVTIYGQSDLVDDGNQTYAVGVGPPAGPSAYAALPAQTVSVTNLDDDTAGITIAAAASPLVTSENRTVATFTVRLNTEPTADVVVPVTSGSVGEGLLSSGAQNELETVSLTFTVANWATPQVVTVTGQDEVSTQTLDDNVTYAVTVGPATGDASYVALAAQAVPVLNTDNDAATVIVPAAGGAALQVQETGTGNTVTFTVAINKPPVTDVVIPVTVSDTTEGLVMGGSSPAVPVETLNLTFTPVDFLTPKVVTVIGQVDNAVDGSQPFTVTLGVPTGDAAYTSLPARTVQVVNADTDVAGYTVTTPSVTAPNLTVTEGAAVDTFTVVLNRAPTADVVIPVASGNSAEGLVAGGDSGGTFGTSLNLTFTPGNWSTAQTVQVKGVADSLDDGNKDYSITVGPTSSSGAYNGLAAKTVSARTVDVDVAGFTVTPLSGLVVTEAGGTATFTVKLDSTPLGTVTVPVSVNDSGETLVSTGGGAPTTFLNLVFTGSDWDTAQTVTVHGVNDLEHDGTAPWTVSVGPTTSGDPKYQALPAKSVAGVTTDDDATNQGSLGTPIDITGLFPYASEVGSGSSYYMVTGLPAGTSALSLTGVAGDVSLTVFGNSNFSSQQLCTSDVGGVTAGEFCSFSVPAGGTVYVRVSAAAGTSGALYTIGQTLTRTSTDVPKTVPSYSSASSVVTVAGGPPTISKVTVQVSVSHLYTGDIAIYLRSPAGTEIDLSSYNGSSGDNYVNTVFDAAAPASIVGATAPFTGTFRPEGLLSSFNGQNANGTWTLRVYDSWNYGGTINSWSITLY